ncbi:hypothetical protein [Streptomyces xanthophaeus]|uniref:Type A2 lantipeptide n=1 Tax=Streptomyces xanthophaeus TaxID=67385 RepID=A0A919LBB8_9ACTN|nr:hypothetical protein [Streptomyces xanthophaeus]WCD85012.1 hypothetical protein KPP03845_101335 [Streptomyces xanthophaeus]WST21158.1 hypothetical protein OG264_06410 [Streptomyces xanthophaeus]WST63855.1 hypothetical protein OG605_31950 [Streptomyces xanthophaeus]GHI83945.1 hypothetical protein Sxan_13090 [Streptomyces xanthophaeus]
MRNDIETREIADAELDAVSGGLVSINGGLAGAVTSDVNGVVGVVGSLDTVQAVTGLVSHVPGLATGITGVSVNAGRAGF